MTRNSLSRRRRTSIRLQCEQLEDRRVLATFTVNDLGDTPDANPGDGNAVDAAGNTTLRAAIEEANALALPDNIDFSVAGTINLSLGELSITSDLSIDGGDAITVNAGGLSRVVKIDDGDGSANRTVSLSNITISGGSAILGGGIYSAESTTLNHATVTGNSVTDGASYAFGGGVLNTGTMTIRSSTISGNSAIHPTGSVTSPEVAVE